MTAVFLNLLMEAFNSHAENISFDDFQYWLLKGDGDKQSSMIFQLLAVANQNERLSVQVDRAKERTKQRKKEKESLQSAEATSAFTNMIDNRVEEFVSLVLAMAPLVRVEKSTAIYADWLIYLQNQFLALSHVDQFEQNGQTNIAMSSAHQSNDEENFFSLLHLEENERAHIFCEQGQTKLAEIRSLILFRIQNCLISRAVTGTFVEYVPFQTDHSAMLSAVATGRFLATHCMQGLQGLHDAESQNLTSRFTYSELLEILSSNNTHLDAAVSLPKSGFPIQYNKKITNAFKSQANALIDEFTKYYASLSKEEQKSFRKNVLEEKVPVTKKRKLTQSKKNNDDDDNEDSNNNNDDDDDTESQDADEKEEQIAKKPFLEVAEQSNVVHSTTDFSASTPQKSSIMFPSPRQTFFFDHEFFGTRNSSTFQSPRVVARSSSLQELTQAPQTTLTCLNCIRLQNDLRKISAGAEFDVSNFFIDHQPVAAPFLPENVDFDQHLLLEKDEQLRLANFEEIRIANKKIESLEQELAITKQQLQECQKLQISAQNAKTLAERELEKTKTKLTTRKSAIRLFDKKKLLCEERLSSLFF